LACATFLAHSSLSVVLIDREGLGGKMVNADRIYGVPEFSEQPSGAMAAGVLAEAAVDAGTRVEFAEITSIERDAVHGSWILSYGSAVLKARVVVLATGSRAMPMSVPGAQRLEGRGISYCAACDGPLFKGKDVAVLMSNQWSADEAIQVARFARSVHALITSDFDTRLEAYLYRLDEFQTVIVNRGVIPKSIIGSEAVAEFSFEVQGELHQIATDGIFASLGTIPNVELVSKFADSDEQGKLAVDQSLNSSNEGLFAIGDIRSGSLETVADCLNDGRKLAERIQFMF
jgi:thioredoxin reductase (NADPH)